MKAFSILIVMVLAGAWGYTSWYWYTCNVRGFCDVSNSENLDILTLSASGSNEDENTGSIQDISQAPRLSADDVLTQSQIDYSESKTGTSNIIEETIVADGEKINNNENLIKEEVVDTRETREASETMKDEDNLSDSTPSSTTTSQGICNGTFIGPIAFGGTNSKVQVELLERFLVSQGENVTIDGEYGAADFEAVKRFQLEYRSEILDPWDITTPTGYVYTTTVKKMKSLACQ